MLQLLDCALFHQMIAFARIALYRDLGVNPSGLAPQSISDRGFEFSLILRKSKKLVKRAMREAGQRFRQAWLAGMASGARRPRPMT